MGLEVSLATDYGLNLDAAYIRVNSIVLGFPPDRDAFAHIRYSVFADASARADGKSPIPGQDGSIMIDLGDVPAVKSLLSEAYAGLKSLIFKGAKDVIDGVDGGVL